MSIKIANRALRRVYAAPIGSLDGATEQKRLIADELAEAVEYALRLDIYSDVTAIFCPGETDVCDPCCDLPTGFCYAFNLPPDYIKAKRVDPKVCGDDCRSLPALQWRVIMIKGCHVLVTDCKPVKMEYVARPENLDALPSDIRAVIYLRLASALAPSLSSDRSLKADIDAELKAAEAKASEISEGQDQADVYLDAPGELLEARGCAWGGGRGGAWGGRRG